MVNVTGDCGHGRDVTGFKPRLEGNYRGDGRLEKQDASSR